MASSEAMQDQVGLDDAEAARRLAQDGPNALPGSEPKALWRIAAGVLAEPMLLMLLHEGDRIAANHARTQGHRPELVLMHTACSGARPTSPKWRGT